MAKRKQEDPIQQDILDMSIEQLHKLSAEAYSEANVAIFDELVRKRDEAQAAVHAHNQRNYQINQRLHQLLDKRNSEREASLIDRAEKV